MSYPLAKAAEEEHRRAVLRVSHVVDVGGHVLETQLEPLPPTPGAPLDDIARAAYQAGRRCHPWIVGDAELAARERVDAVRESAFREVGELLKAGAELMYLINRVDELASGRMRSDPQWCAGYAAAIEHLKQTEAMDNLRVRTAGVRERLNTLKHVIDEAAKCSGH